ncbi:MAG: FAD-binding oxidoreductase [Alphaproteobacteria bacterium]|nr:FAD-binding oxidoreductase [Alphaproteobacteria bacterium]
MSTPYWRRLHPGPPLPSEPPERVDVAVVGGGLAGLSCALFLALGGARVAVLEAAPRLGAGASGRDPGLVQVGTVEPPESLSLALGVERAREYVQFSRRSAALLRAHVPLLRSGGLRFAMLPRELDYLEASVAASLELGLPAELLDEAAVAARVGVEGLGPARFVPEDAQLDPLAALEALAAQAQAAGAQLLGSCPVQRVEHAGAHMRLHLPEGHLDAELVVLAAAAGLPALDGSFQELLHPVREQCLAFADPGLRLGLGGSGQLGYLHLNQAPDGALLVGGARWASPHMEVGEADASVVNIDITEKLLAFARRRFPQLGEAAPLAAWSRVQANACDGLPFVGPLPGRGRVVACTGFCGQEWGLAMQAARCVSAGLLTGELGEIPSFLLPGRML